MTTYIGIIAVVTFLGMWAITNSLWKGICYTIWVFAALFFWYCLAVAVGLTNLPQ